MFGVIALILGITAFLPEQGAGKDQKDKGEISKGEGTKGTIGQSGAGGSGRPSAGGGNGSGNGGGLTPVERLLQADQEPPAASPPANGERKEDLKAADAGGTRLNEGVVPSGPGAAPVRFGVQHPSNPNYLMVKVRSGDTFGQIVERECGSLQHYLEQAIALNEAVEPANLKVGQELILPFVPEDQLPRRTVKADALSAHQAPTPANATFGNVAPEGERKPLAGDKSADKKAGDKNATPKDKSNPAGMSLAASTQSTSYKVQKGDTLWALAEKKWGKGKAKSKVQEILALNTGTLKSESDLRAGQVIKLP